MDRERTTQPPEKPARRRKRRRNPFLRILGGFFLTIWTLLLIGVCTAVLMLSFFKKYVETTLAPSLEVRAEDYTMNLSSFIYYQDKETGEWVEFQSVHGTENRILVDFDQIPDYLWQAAVAIEDERFFSHQGVDWKRTARAVLEVAGGDSSMGGSTITQQVLKNMTKDKQPYINRKIREIFRALEFEKNYEKEDILELYLNTIYLGKGCYGVQTAAQFYFGKDVSELSLAECASLIAITNNPSMYGPMYNITITREDGTTTTPREANKRRQKDILDKMASVIDPRTGKTFITEAEAAAAKAEILQFSDGSTSAEEIVEKTAGAVEINSWFVDQVIRDVSADLAEKYGIGIEEARLRMYNSGFHIYTTLDPRIQNIAESVYEDRSNLDVTSRDGQPIRSGITIIEPTTGNVVATVGDIGEKTGNLIMSYAMDRRQVGSSIKPLTAYAPALDAGMITPGSAFDNYPVQLLNNNPWPKNTPAGYSGFTSVRYGLQESINTIAVRTLQTVGIEAAFAFATDNLGLNLEPEDAALASLGMGGLTRGLNTMEMAAAYVPFMNRGIYNSPRTYVRVTRMNADGVEEVVLDNESESHVAMKENTAYLMTNMLQNVVENGNGRPARISGMTVAGKTGTTSDNYDRYFVGYTPYYVAAVWTGYKYNAKINYQGNPAVTMWKKVMEQVHEGLPNKEFEKPATGLETITVCRDSGLKLTAACGADPRGNRAASYLAAAGSGPSEACNLHTVVRYCVDGHCLAGETCPEESVVEQAYLDYDRPDYGVSASDDAYLLRNVNPAAEGCPAHTGEGLVDPNEPDLPDVDLENPEAPGTDPGTVIPPTPPTQPTTPTQPNNPETPENPGTTTSPPLVTPVPDDTPDPPEPTPPAEPSPPQDPGTDGDWWEGMWNSGG